MARSILRATNKIGLNIDLAPTIIDLVGGMVPDIMDGQSLKPWLYGNQSVSDEKQQFLIEYYGNAESYEKTVCCADIYPCDLDGWTNYCDSWNNTYHCVRMIDARDTINQINGTIYCQFKCYGPGRQEVECEDDGSAQSYGEYYELDTDYYELDNKMLQLNDTTKQMYDNMMQNFLTCKGQTECNTLRQG